MKHRLSCLIYYMKLVEADQLAINKQKCSSPLRLVTLSLVAAAFVFETGGIDSVVRGPNSL